MKTISHFRDNKEIQEYIQKLTKNIELIGSTQALRVGRNKHLCFEEFLYYFFELNPEEIEIKHKEDGIN